MTSLAERTGDSGLARPVVIERCATPRGEIQLQRRGEEHEIISNGVFLSSSTDGHSTKVLVRAAIEWCGREPRGLLIGGLGIGRSLGEAVAHPSLQRIVVIEVEEAVIRWHHDHLAEYSEGALTDPRVEIVHADLLRWITEADETFDAVCVDIDNGPDWTVTPENADLYAQTGLAALARLVAPGGALAFWTAHRSPAFVERLRQHVDRVIRVSVPSAHAEPDSIYVGRVGSAEDPGGRIAPVVGQSA